MSAPQRTALALSALLSVAFIGGCASELQTSVSFDPLTRFPTTATTAWDDGANRLPRDQRLAELNMDAIIKRVVDSELAVRGYRGSENPPDYLLSYTLGVNTWHGPEGSLSVASLSLQINDADSGRRVWVGFAKADVHVGLNEAERETRVRSAVQKLLGNFPPAQR